MSWRRDVSQLLVTTDPAGTDRNQSRRGALAAKAAVIYIKGDWMEYVTTLSFPSCTHNVHPCPMCFRSPNTMYGLKNFTLEAVSWDLKTVECEHREIHVVVDGSGHAKILIQRTQSPLSKCSFPFLSSILWASSTSPILSTPALGYCERQEISLLKQVFQLLTSIGRGPLVNTNLFGFSLLGSSIIRDCDCKSCNFQSAKRS